MSTAARTAARDATEASLPMAFTWSEARDRGLSERRIRALQEQGLIESLARGLYLRSDAPPHEADLLQVAAKVPQATLCLRSALARHDLIDDIPDLLDLALPRGRRHPTTGAPVRWHAFDPATFDLGRQDVALSGGLTVGLYGPERSIVDAFRLRHREGPELAHDALKAWLRQRGNLATLLKVALAFPQGEPALHRALQVLL